MYTPPTPTIIAGHRYESMSEAARDFRIHKSIVHRALDYQYPELVIAAALLRAVAYGYAEDSAYAMRKVSHLTAYYRKQTALA